LNRASSAAACGIALASVVTSARADTELPPEGSTRWGWEPPANPAKPAEHALFAEVGGAAGIYSLNYEYRPIPEFGARVGASFFPCLFNCQPAGLFPMSLHAIAGEGSHSFELGGGVMIATSDRKDGRLVYPEFGYRYERPDGGFLFRATMTPFFRISDLKFLIPWGGISFGTGW
jgi:hypothetical protein